MEAEALDLDEYTEVITQYVMGRLQEADVELSDEDVQRMPSMLRNGFETARDSGQEHWEVACRGAVEVLVERMQTLAHPDATLPARAAGSDLHQEDMVFVERLSLEAGETVSIIKICPLWPFC